QLSALAAEADIIRSCMAFTADGREIALAAADGKPLLCEVSTGKVLHRWLTPEGGVCAMAFHPEGTILAAGTRDNCIVLWDMRKGKELAILRGHSAQISALTFSPDGRRLVSAGWDFSVKLWDADTRREVLTLRLRRREVLFSLAFNQDGSLLTGMGIGT